VPCGEAVRREANNPVEHIMSDREAFLRHIAAHPDADLPRLVFADWLDERDDPLGLFIRTQIELDPIRDRIELPRVRELLAVEKQLLFDHMYTWLDTTERVPRDVLTSVVHLRRGLPHAVCLTARELGEYGNHLMEAFPTVRELAVCELSGDPEAVASHDFLRRVDVLELADIPDPDDFATLLESNLFGRQPTIRLRNADFGSCPLFGIRPDQWRPGGIVEYVQLIGGVSARELALAYDLEADDCAAEFNAVWGEGAVKVTRPFQRTYPVHEDEEDYPPGRFADGRAGILFWGGSLDAKLSVAGFDGTRFLGTRDLPTPQEEYWDEIVAAFRQEHDFRKESIRVPEFRTERGFGVKLWSDHWVSGWERGSRAFLWDAWRRTFERDFIFQGVTESHGNGRGFSD
jgi:uncharacterized protein (TIGR02996 family)